MIIYVDILLIINFLFDFCILLSVDLTLKRKVKIKRLILASLIGEISLLALFFEINFIFKIIIGIILNIFAFNYKNIKYTVYNTLYYFLYSMFLGAFVYFLTVQFRIDLVYSIKYLIIICLTPFATIIYYKLIVKMKNDYKNQVDVEIKYDKYSYKAVGLIDSGNKLEAYGKMVILVEKKYINYQKLKLLPVYYNALNHAGIVFCFKPNEFIINGKSIKNVLVGLSDKSFNIDGVTILLNSKMEGLWF